MAMKKMLLASVAVLFLATGTAHAVDWQCGPHYVNTFVLHGEKRNSIIAYPYYNRTREDVIKNAPHPEFRGQRLLTYRGKPCLQYPIEAQQ